jgi:hypothetical protein
MGFLVGVGREAIVGGWQGRGLGVRYFVEAVVDGLTFRESGEEPPGDDLAGVGAGLGEPAVVAVIVGRVVPSQCPGARY